MTTNNWRDEFDSLFKHVHHPLIQGENIVIDTKPIKEFISRVREEAKEEERKYFLNLLKIYTVHAPESSRAADFTLEQFLTLIRPLSPHS